MLKLKIPTKFMNDLIDEALSHFDPVILERGWEYFHTGYVANLELIQENLLTARVRGGTAKYEVTLDLHRFSRSTCGCAYAGYCKHMAAVFFSAYAQHGRPELLLHQLKGSIRTRSRTTKSAAAKAAKAKEIVPQISATDSPKEWQRFFDQRFHGYALNQQNSIDLFYTTAYEDLTKPISPWVTPLRELFKLHVLLYILRKIDQFFDVNQASYLSYYHETACRTVAQQCKTKLIETAATLPAKKIRQNHPLHWQETVAIIGETALQGKPSVIDWLGIYRSLWWKLFYGAEEVEQERKRIELLLKQPELTPRKEDTLLIALAHFDIMAKNDDAAFLRLQALHAKLVADFYIVLQGLLQNEQWERMLVWLRWLLPAMAKAKQEDFHAVCSYWLEAMKHQPSDEEWIRAMLALLPRSYAYYTEYLITTKRYKQWVDLQLSHYVNLENIFGAQLREVEAYDPSLLLPLYHQSVEKAIAEKNRTSYMTAVKQLKKLDTLYKQLQQQDRWNEYIYRLAAKHSRLRAFQEELKKGKWQL